MNSNTTSITLSSCAKTFNDGTRALDPVNLEVKGGETLVLLGPSGCGKTTLLRIIAGLEMPDFGGRVKFNDEDVTESLVENRNVGMVFQSYALFPNMTVAKNIAYGLRVRKMAAADVNARVNEMLDMMHISELRNRRIDQLSGGQCQRVALARAIAVRPRVLLLDEPSNDLDVETLRALEGALLEFAGSALVISHDRWFLDRIATHILAFEGDSHVEFFAGNYHEYEEDKRRRLGDEGAKPKRIRYKSLK